MPGRLSYNKNFYSDVGDSESVEVALEALDAATGGPTARPSPGTKVRQIPVGGVEGASLTSASSDVTIRALFDMDASQVIAAPGDTARWEWAVSASEPGDYTLKLRLSTYQGSTHRALATLSPPVAISLHVGDTVVHRVSGFRGAWVAWSGFVGATLVILTFKTPLVQFARTRREAWREKRRQGRDGYM